nr:MAG TPA: hypothetical protein [Caudoviricetes sp.]
MLASYLFFFIIFNFIFFKFCQSDFFTVIYSKYRE